MRERGRECYIQTVVESTGMKTDGSKHPICQLAITDTNRSLTPEGSHTPVFFTKDLSAPGTVPAHDRHSTGLISE